MQNKQKILLAVGERNLENFLKERLSKEYTFVQEASYREIVIKRIKEGQPDIILLREALKGSMSVENLVLDIRETFPGIRIVFYTSKYRPGEPLLRKLVSYGVYNFIAGESVTESQIFDAIRNERQLSDVRQYLDAPTLQSNEPAMMVTTEYKDLSHTQTNLPPESMEQIVQPVLEPEAKEKKNKKGLLQRLFKRHEDKQPKVNNVKKKKQQKQFEFDENLEEEEDIWDAPEHLVAQTEKEVGLKMPDAPKPEDDKDIKLGQHTNPLPMFNSGSSQETSKPQKTPVAESFPDTQNAPVTTPSPVEKVNVVVDNSSGQEEYLFTVVEKEPKEEHKERLTIPVRGKPTDDDVSLHQRELHESGEREYIQPVEDYIEPEIDFNPMEVDEPQRATIEAPPVIKPRKETINKRKHKPIEHNEEKSIGWFGRLGSGKIKMRTKQIVTFVSAVHGSGNTHVAFNSALKLADEGNRVLYLDMNPTFSAVDFSFQLGTWQQGIDKALEDIEYNKGMNVSSNILRMEEILKNRNEKNIKELYKALPPTLDYMFYSLDYQTLEEQHPVPKERLKDLVMYLITREDYDVLIVDSEPLGEVGVDGLLNISNKIYITMTQDPGQMGVFHRQFDAAKKRVDITDERYIVVNQFVNTEPKVNRVQKWTNEVVLQTVPFTHKGVIQANYLGEPFVLKTRHQPAINAFESLAEHIAE